MSLPICWSFRGGGGAGCVAGTCCAVGCCAGGDGFLHPDPRTRKPVKTASGILRRVRKSVFVGGKSSVLRLSCTCSSFDEGNRHQAGTHRGIIASHECCLSTGCLVKVWCMVSGC